MFKRIIPLLLCILLLPVWALAEEAQENTKLTHYLLLGQDGYAEDIVKDARTDTIVLVTVASGTVGSVASGTVGSVASGTVGSVAHT